MTKTRLWTAFLCISMGPALASAATPVDLVCEYQTNPLGIDEPHPRLSWKIASERPNWRQSAYQIQVRTEGALLWDTGKVVSKASIHRPYQGPPLRSATRYTWRVRVWDKEDRASPWSETAHWEMGLVDPSEWKAEWVTPDTEPDPTRSEPAPMLRGTFSVEVPVRSARAYVTSLGLYRMELNGRPVGDQLFTPGWTAYHKRLQYQTYDVTELLRAGENAVGVTLGDGWYRGLLGFEGKRHFYGDRLALLAQIRIVYENGDVAVVGTDGSWKASTGPIRMSDIYMGEVYDARLEKDGWSLPGFDDREWKPVRLLEPPSVALVAPTGPPVRRIETLRPVAILHTPNGETVFDLGQNMVGWVELHVDPKAAPSGHTITLRHGEVLDADGNLYTDNLRRAAQRVSYVLDGKRAVFEPHFTFQGFRYVAVRDYPGEPSLDSLRGIVLHSDLETTGTFETSNPMLNQLQHNIVWGLKGNFLDVPTDCPQRDERMGWTGDAQVFARTAAFNRNVAGFFTKWLRDLAADQYANGSVPWVIPDVLSANGRGAGAAGWADAATIVPWTLYRAYGDTRILERQYESMKAWVEFMRREAREDLVWRSGFHFGDWLAYSSTDPAYPGATTGKDFIATAFFAHSTGLLARTARVLGREQDARTYEALRRRIEEAFEQEFVTAAGRVAENTQTAYALALAFDLLPESLRPEAAARLVGRIRRRDDHLTTGFLGAPHVNDALTRSGHLDVAYDLLLQTSYPSWLYPITKGATTIWERWDGIKPDGTFQTPDMNSFNHYAYGAVGDWMYRTVAGIDTDPSAPGYQRAVIRPQPPRDGTISSAGATIETMYGRLSSKWQIEGGDRLALSIVVPANTMATIHLPDGRTESVGSGAYRFESQFPARR